MSSKFVEFPLSILKSDEGVVLEPLIPISILTFDGFKLFDFIVDSGADFTVLPKKFASLIGIDLSKCRISATMGVEGKLTKIYKSHIVIQIGSFQRKIRCAFLNHNKTPPLLGRMDVFSKFNIIFNAKKKQIVFSKS